MNYIGSPRAKRKSGMSQTTFTPVVPWFTIAGLSSLAMSDYATKFATIDLKDLLNEMR
jgi:hypothetical protein